MITIVNPNGAKRVFDKVCMLKSNRDGRLGVILDYNDTECVVKMENIEKPLRFDIPTVCKGFKFIFSKKESVEEWYMIKNRRGLVPRLRSELDCYVSMHAVQDDLKSHFQTLTNHEVYVILNNLRKKFQNG